jgi:hypothetical protein
MVFGLWQAFFVSKRLSFAAFRRLAAALLQNAKNMIHPIKPFPPKGFIFALSLLKYSQAYVFKYTYYYFYYIIIN